MSIGGQEGMGDGDTDNNNDGYAADGDDMTYLI